jgi:hypothetical protein
MTRDSETIKRLTDLAVREYDALRKGIDDRMDVTKTYGWPVVIVAIGALAGFKSDLIDSTTMLTFIPALVFTVAALDANANHDKARVRRALALVEDRLFILSNCEPAICYESISFLKCKARAVKGLRQALAYTSIYAVIETAICLLLLRPKLAAINWPRTFLFFAVLCIPAAILVYSSYGIYRIFTAPLETLLIGHIRNSKSLPPDGIRLLYDTKPEPHRRSQ